MRFRSFVARCVSRGGRSTTLALIALCALSPAALAQTQPMPVLPPDPPVTADPAGTGEPAAGPVGTASTTAAVRPQPWEYGFGLGAGWDSNIDFRVPDGPSSTAIVPRGNLGHVFWGPKGELRLAGSGYWIGYVEEKDQSRYNAVFSLGGTYRSSLDTTWRADVSYNYGYSDSSSVLAEQGVLLPIVPAQTGSVGLGVKTKLGRRTTLRIDAQGYGTTFDQQDSATVVAGLVDSRSLRGTTALDWKIGSRDTVGVVYSLEATVYRPPAGALDEANRSYLTHYGSMQWSHVLSPRSAFMLEGGSSYTPDPEQAGLAQPWSFFGGVSYNRKVKRSSLQLFARREVAPAFGLGVSRLENRFGLDAVVPLGRSWTLTLTAIHVLPETPEGAGNSYATPDEAAMGLGVRLGRLFQVSAEGRYRRRSATDAFPAIDGFQAGLFLSLVSPGSQTSTMTLGRY